MNSTHTLPSVSAHRPPAAPASSPVAVADVVQTRFALRVASRLTERCEGLSPDIAERLRFAREQALQRARTAQAASGAGRPATVSPTRGASAGPWSSGWRLKFVGVVPVLALVGGLLLIEQWQDNTQIAAAAEVDAALLSDDLPPTAYSDAGFVEYLKTSTE